MGEHLMRGNVHRALPLHGEDVLIWGAQLSWVVDEWAASEGQYSSKAVP